MLTGEELVAGSTVTYEAEVPPAILHPGNGAEPPVAGTVRLRPLTVGDLQTITRAQSLVESKFKSWVWAHLQ